MSKKKKELERHPQAELCTDISPISECEADGSEAKSVTATSESNSKTAEETTTNEVEKEYVNNLPEKTPDDVKDFLTGETDELPAGSEIISEEEAKKLEEKAFEELDKELEENSYDDENNIEEDSSNEEEKLTPTPEVIANTKEEKILLEQKNAHTSEIQELEEKNSVLEREAEKFDNLASTMNSEPFVELKSIVKEAIKTYTDREDVKEVKKKIKNFEAICSMENLLKEYNSLAVENRQNITANNNEIENLKNKIKEIDSKLHNFQQKLDLGQ